MVRLAVLCLFLSSCTQLGFTPSLSAVNKLQGGVVTYTVRF